MSYSPLGSPGRLDKSDDEPVLLNDPVVKEIADKYKVTSAQVYNNYEIFLFCANIRWTKGHSHLQ